MANDRLALAPGYRLALQARRAYIVRIEDGARLSALQAAEAVFVGVMDGRRSMAQLQALVATALGTGAASGLQYLVDRLAPLLGSGATDAAHSLRELSDVLPPDPAEGIRLLPGPRVLHWHVTQYCPRRCAYCYADPVHGSAALDATVPLDVMRRVFQEAAQLGATQLLVSGAEPLLRPDLPEAIASAISCGLGILLTTKFPISASLAARLAQGGLKHISLSLDSLDAQENRALIGSATYADQMTAAMRHLHQAGMAFSIQSVVTPLNVGSVEALAKFAEAHGARVMQLVPYKDVLSPIANLRNDQLRLADDAIVDELCTRLARACPGLRIERFKEATDSGGFHCDIGQTKLLILPDGVVHRCYKLTTDTSLRGMDLKQASLARAWHDPQFVDTIQPPPEAYTDQPCNTCSSKSGCDRSGRCIYDAHVHHGRYAAPDRACGGRRQLVNRSRVITIRAI